MEWKVDYIYRNKNKIREIHYNRREEIIREIIYKYNSKGDMVEDMEYEDKFGEMVMVNFYRYEIEIK